MKFSEEKDKELNKREDNVELIERSQKKIIYKIEDWVLSIASYTKTLNVDDPLSYFVMVESLIDKNISIICYPETKRIYYRLGTNVLSEEGLLDFIENLKRRQEMVNTIKTILKNETGIDYM